MSSADAINHACRVLEHCIRRYGADSAQAKDQAIAVCRVGGVDPFFRHAIRNPEAFSIDTTPPSPVIPFKCEWQLMIERVVNQRPAR